MRLLGIRFRPAYRAGRLAFGFKAGMTNGAVDCGLRKPAMATK